MTTTVLCTGINLNGTNCHNRIKIPINFGHHNYVCNKHNDGTDDKNSCCICYSKYDVKKNIKVELGCFHCICYNCFLKVDACPLCRKVILDKSDEGIFKFVKKEIANINKVIQIVQQLNEEHPNLKFNDPKFYKIIDISKNILNTILTVRNQWDDYIILSPYERTIIIPQIKKFKSLSTQFFKGYYKYTSKAL